MADIFCSGCGKVFDSQARACPRCARCPGCGLKQSEGLEKCPLCSHPCDQSIVAGLEERLAPELPANRWFIQRLEMEGRKGQILIVAYVTATMLLSLLWPATLDDMYRTPWGNWLISVTFKLDWLLLMLFPIVTLGYVFFVVLLAVFQFRLAEVPNSLRFFLVFAFLGLLSCWVPFFAYRSIFLMLATTLLLFLESCCRRFWVRGLLITGLAGCGTVFYFLALLSLEAVNAV